MHHLEFDTPLGAMLAIADNQHLTGLFYKDQTKQPSLAASKQHHSHPVLLQTKKQLEDYFAGQRQRFSIPLKVQTTAFQKSVWEVLSHIRPGETWSYKKVAERIGKPTSIRAVANAISRNPFIIVIPCHRVTGIKGELRGYAAGVDRQRHLLLQESSTLGK
ncbi:hypothetical protein CWI84_05870 [Idiomarina tyrosinivorans]|uniref:methylated-DNA--[protein]-cysteine S-methyltransferase n=1 Tax=Idiomarina tyrosinivorans TaxID=1445662 RepID=A0A432ZRP6_9GAMM|nr:methylated-DNA--[protein]-cysteine S-methyltransferase [Idiomarina tyrosinivorans]RUO80584.1 hypothetical protein CWI84_05870 [Idiomarina tyrosinivorans]